MDNTQTLILSAAIVGILASVVVVYLQMTPTYDNISMSCELQGNTPLVTSGKGVTCMDGNQISWVYCYGDDSAATTDFDKCYRTLYNN